MVEDPATRQKVKLYRSIDVAGGRRRRRGRGGRGWPRRGTPAEGQSVRVPYVGSVVGILGGCAGTCSRGAATPGEASLRAAHDKIARGETRAASWCRSPRPRAAESSRALSPAGSASLQGPGMLASDSPLAAGELARARRRWGKRVEEDDAASIRARRSSPRINNLTKARTRPVPPSRVSNPAYSVKCRIGRSCGRGEASASSTSRPPRPPAATPGSARAFAAAAHGYECVSVMPETISAWSSTRY